MHEPGTCGDTEEERAGGGADGDVLDVHVRGVGELVDEGELGAGAGDER